MSTIASACGLAIADTRFWAKVRKSDGAGCWEWTASRYGSGYGQFFPERGRPMHAHRWSYANKVGPIPPGMLVLHRCDNRRCVRPDHLFVGTQADNVADAKAKGRLRNPSADANRSKTACVRGHRFSPENTRTYANGRRSCRECERIKKRRLYHKWKAAGGVRVGNSIRAPRVSEGR